MKRSKTNMPSVSESRRQAGAALERHESRLTLIGAILVMLPTVMLYVGMQSLSILLYHVLSKGGTQRAELFTVLVLSLCLIAVIALTLLLTLPLVVGYLEMARRAWRGETVALADLFFAFSSVGRYARAIGISWYLLWRAGLGLFVVGATAWIGFIGIGSIWSGLICIGLVLIELSVLFCIFGRSFLSLAAALDRGVSIKEAKRFARGHTNLRAAWAFFRHFFFRVLLGLVTIGILLLWDTIPRMAVTYFGYAERILNENTIRTEEIEHE